jgi:hypothetical protein
MSPVQDYREVLPKLRSAMSIRPLSILSQIVRLLLSHKYLNHKATVSLDLLVVRQEIVQVYPAETTLSVLVATTKIGTGVRPRSSASVLEVLTLFRLDKSAVPVQKDVGNEDKPRQILQRMREHCVRSRVYAQL